MRKSKLLVSIVAAILSAMLLVGCGAGSVSVGKKYDAVLYSLDEVTVVLDGDKYVMYNEGKKVTKKGYVSIEALNGYDYKNAKIDNYNEYFLVRKEMGGDLYLVNRNGKEKKIENKDVVSLRAYADIDTDEKNISTYTTAGFIATTKDGMDFVGTDGKGLSIYSENIVEIKYMGEQLFEVKTGNDMYPYDKYYIYKSDGTRIHEETNHLGAGKDIRHVGNTMFYIVDGNNNTLEIRDANGNIVASNVKRQTVNDITVYTGNTKFVSYTTDIGSSELYIISEDGSTQKIDYLLATGNLLTSKLFVDTENEKIYVKEVNTSNDKYRVHELGGDYTGEWVDYVNEVANGLYVTVNEGTTTAYNYEHEVLFKADKAVNNSSLQYAEYADGVVARVEYGDTLYFNLFGQEKKHDITGKILLYYGLDMFAVETADLGENATVYNTYGKFDVKDAEQKGNYYTFTYNNKAYAVLASQMKYFGKDGADLNLYPNVSDIEDIEIVTGSFNSFVWGEKVNYVDVDAIKQFRTKAAIRVETAIVKDENAQEQKAVISYGTAGSLYKTTTVQDAANVESLGYGNQYVQVAMLDGTISVYMLSGYGDKQELKAVIKGLPSTADPYVTTDAFGNDYIVTEEKNGRSSIYNGSGTLLLAPKYYVEDVANGIAIVCKSGDEDAYCGAVKLGKKASKAKLIVGLENEDYQLSSTGDFMMRSADEKMWTMYNAKGKEVMDEIIDYDFVGMSETYSYKNAYASKEKKRTANIMRLKVYDAKGNEAVVTISLSGKEITYKGLMNAY